MLLFLRGSSLVTLPTRWSPFRSLDGRLFVNYVHALSIISTKGTLRLPTTYDDHPSNPTRPQSLFNHLNRPWIVPSQPSMTRNDYRWLSDDNLMTIGWLSDDYPMIMRWQSNDYHELLIYFLDDHWSKKIYRPKMIVKSGAILLFILKWSCYVVWDTHSNLVQAQSICCNCWNILIKDNFLQQYVWI